jgi:hypothetical protein
VAFSYRFAQNPGYRSTNISSLVTKEVSCQISSFLYLIRYFYRYLLRAVPGSCGFGAAKQPIRTCGKLAV